MATKEETHNSDIESKDSVTCSPCLEVGRTADAIRFCVQCDTYLCEECLQDHNKFAALRKHQVTDKLHDANQLGETGQSKEDIKVECSHHYGQYVDTYCKDHDEVCCSVCVTIKHRSCKQTETILKVAKGIKENKAFSDTKRSLGEFLLFSNQEKVDRNKNLTGLDEEKNQILVEIDTFENNLKEKIAVIAETSREHVRAIHANHVKAVRSDDRELDTVMSVLTESVNELNKINKSEVETFVSFKNCQKTLAQVKAVVNDLSDKWLQTELYYNFNDAILKTDTTMFGDIMEENKTDEVYYLKCKKILNIESAIDTRTKSCKIKGICNLLDGAYAIIDSNHSNLTRLTEVLEVRDVINFKRPPMCICVTGPKEVAVLFPEINLIQFVNVDDSLSVGSSISTPGNCTLINYDDRQKQLYLCCTEPCPEKVKRRFHYCFMSTKSSIFVCDRKGSMLTKYEQNKEGENIFSRPYQIFIGPKYFVVVDTDKWILACEKTGEQQMPKRFQAYISDENCLCVLPKVTLLFQNANGKLTLIQKDGRIDKVLEMKNKQTALAAVFNRQRSSLIVATESGEIREYKMPLKVLLLLQ